MRRDWKEGRNRRWHGICEVVAQVSFPNDRPKGRLVAYALKSRGKEQEEDVTLGIDQGCMLSRRHSILYPTGLQCFH